MALDQVRTGLLDEIGTHIQSVMRIEKDASDQYQSEVSNLELEILFQQGLQARWREDFSEALKIFRQLAERGHGDAMARLGLTYKQSYGVEQDRQKNRYWMERSAKLGYQPAIDHIAAKF